MLKNFCLTKPMGALWKFFCYKAGCFCLLLWFADIHLVFPTARKKGRVLARKWALLMREIHPKGHFW